MPTLAAAVVVAGGTGRRLGGEVAKQYLEIDGKPVLQRAITPFLEHPAFGCVAVVLPPEDAADPPRWLRDLGVVIVPGGAERSDSVWNGLRALPPDLDPVLIHDGARPFVSRQVIDRVLEAARSGPAIAAIRVADTIKEVDADGRIVTTPDRTRLWQAQTPQGFPRSVIITAHQRARAERVPATDDAMLVERLGEPVRVVEGAAVNLKITRPADLAIARALASHLDSG
jgi:2-C-methyl-D-erythritol 4-phosphate cytidylyltransferase